jgi:hypothetical protein
MKTICLLSSLTFITLTSGCSPNSEVRLRLSGEATFEGQPIPFGEVLLTPDGSKGNKGPQGIAPIRNGKYDTASNRDKGYAGGHTIIRVTGFAGPGGKLICDYELKADLPQQDATHNINVPKEGAAKPNATSHEI